MTARTQPPLPTDLARAELRPRRSARVLAVGFALVCLVVSAIGMHWSDNLPRFHVATAQLGEPFVLGSARFTVVDIDVADTLANTDGEPIAHTGGVFVAVDVVVQRLDDRRQPTASRLVTPGHRYQSWDGRDIILVDVGYEAKVRIVTEVDPSELADLAIQIYPIEIISGYGRRVNVPLDLGRHVDQLLAAAGKHAIRQINVEQVIAR